MGYPATGAGEVRGRRYQMSRGPGHLKSCLSFQRMRWVVYMFPQLMRWVVYIKCGGSCTSALYGLSQSCFDIRIIAPLFETALHVYISLERYRERSGFPDGRPALPESTADRREHMGIDRPQVIYAQEPGAGSDISGSSASFHRKTRRLCCFVTRWWCYQPRNGAGTKFFHCRSPIFLRVPDPGEGIPEGIPTLP